MRARTEIERFYHERRLWPEGNPQPKPALDAVLPAARIEAQVRDSQAMETVLQQRWRLAITPAMVRREFARISRESRDPRGLAELFRRLGNDPDLIAQSLVRPLLAERLLRAQYENDAALHAPERLLAQDGRRRALAGDWRGAGGEYQRLRVRRRTDAPAAAAADTAEEAVLAPEEFAALRGSLNTAQGREELEETPGGYLLRRLESETADALLVETLFFPKRDFTGWWRLQAATVSVAEEAPDAAPPGRYTLPAVAASAGCDTWSALSPLSSTPPVARAFHVAVWTGAEMIVWGGFGFSGYLNTGARFDPVTGIWRDTVLTGAPASRTSATAVWTGSEMIVWGGYNAAVLLTQGSRYNPLGDGWTAVPSSGEPTPRRYHSAVWTGTEMIIWGGSDPAAANSGARYQPVTDSWTPIASIGAPVNTGGANHYEPPDSPANGLRASRSATLDLAWTGAAGAAAYRVLACQPGGSGCTPATLLGTPATSSFSEPLDAISRFYTVESANACGNTP